MARFSFGVKKAAKKPTGPKIKNLTENQIDENEKGIADLMDPANDPVIQHFRKENLGAKKKQDDKNETYFYVCAIFQSRAQKMEFLAQIPNVLCVDDVFIDGETFAKAVGKPVTLNEAPPLESPLHKILSKLVKIPSLPIESSADSE